ncbi:MAG: FAD:protein FMN transferase [Pelagimonas sp.]|uniref:FAD:protein FMN transferase n=1 Tax=Pelagimonas sp. TaxID=2073170 RepID=UPI003D6B83BB
MTVLTRRRFLTIAAAGGAVAACPVSARTPVARWTGRALGAGASMQLVGLGGDAAAEIFAQVEAEILRLEAVFSLYDPQSELSRLNQDGTLAGPSFDFLQVLSLSNRLNVATKGRFDPSIQSLWHAKATGGDLEAAMALVGWHNVHFESSRITVGRGQSLTFNGIAQGYITDKIAALLRGHGLSDVLVDMGEVMGLGNRPDGTPWKLGVAAPDGQILHRVQLSDRALATSATHGTVLAGGPHILDPKGDGGQPVLVSVSAPSAALADGLSTALCLTDETQRVLSQFPKAELILRA